MPQWKTPRLKLGGSNLSIQSLNAQATSTRPVLVEWMHEAYISTSLHWRSVWRPRHDHGLPSATRLTVQDCPSSVLYVFGIVLHFKAVDLKWTTIFTKMHYILNLELHLYDHPTATLKFPLWTLLPSSSLNLQGPGSLDNNSKKSFTMQNYNFHPL